MLCIPSNPHNFPPSQPQNLSSSNPLDSTVPAQLPSSPTCFMAGSLPSALLAKVRGSLPISWIHSPILRFIFNSSQRLNSTPHLYLSIFLWGAHNLHYVHWSSVWLSPYRLKKVCGSLPNQRFYICIKYQVGTMHLP